MPLTERQKNLQAAKDQKQYAKAALRIGRPDLAYIAAQGQRQYLAAAHQPRHTTLSA
jgi:hypothetical protein